MIDIENDVETKISWGSLFSHTKRKKGHKTILHLGCQERCQQTYVAIFYWKYFQNISSIQTYKKCGHISIYPASINLRLNSCFIVPYVLFINGSYVRFGWVTLTKNVVFANLHKSIQPQIVHECNSFYCYIKWTHVWDNIIYEFAYPIFSLHKLCWHSQNGFIINIFYLIELFYAFSVKNILDINKLYDS